ncbi:hypothetical protein Bca4012_024440 [Brassica carinata]
MWWPLWPPLFAVKFDVIVVVHRKGGFRGDGVVEWNEEFKRVCEFSVYKEGEFLP